MKYRASYDDGDTILKNENGSECHIFLESINDFYELMGFLGISDVTIISDNSIGDDEEEFDSLDLCDDCGELFEECDCGDGDMDYDY
jgi:hypothetical protein